MVIWIIGLSGAGKTALGKELALRIRGERPNTVFIDGDMVREIMGNDLSHSLADRKINADRICRLCKVLDEQRINVVCGILSLFPESRAWNREYYRAYFEIYIDVSMETLFARNQKGLYSAAREGRVRNVAGVDLPFAPPESPDFVFTNNTNRSSFGDVVDAIMTKLPPLD